MSLTTAQQQIAFPYTKIALRAEGYVEESGVSASLLYPGMNVIGTPVADTTNVPSTSITPATLTFPADGALDVVQIVVNKDELGATVFDSIAIGDSVKTLYATKGDVVLLMVEDSVQITARDVLYFNGAGKARKADSASDPTVPFAIAVSALGSTAAVRLVKAVIL
jgi:hypothetical protein